MATFITGGTGIGTGPHLDFRVYDVASNTYLNPKDFTDLLQVNGQPLTDQFQMTSGFGPRAAPTPGASTDHKGIDYGTPEGTKVDILGGKHLATFDTPKGGVMSQYAIQRDGRNYDILLLHGSRDNPITSSAAVTDFDYSTLGTSPATGDTAGTIVDEQGEPVKLDKKVTAKEKAKQYKTVARTADEVAEGMGNFSDMKSSRLADALRGASADIIQRRMDAGEGFGTKQVEVGAEEDIGPGKDYTPPKDYSMPEDEEKTSPPLYQSPEDQKQPRMAGEKLKDLEVVING